MTRQQSRGLLCGLLLAVAGCAGAPKVYWSRESGPPSRGHYRNMRAADLNGDGLLDLVGASASPGGASVWLGRGDGSWIPFRGPTSEGKCNDVAVGDVNSDGLPDVITVGSGELLGVFLITFYECLQHPSRSQSENR